MRTSRSNRGSADGVQADMAVIAPTGIVGRVIGRPAAHAARVQLLIDRNAAAGRADRADARRAGWWSALTRDPPLQMELVSNLADVKRGDIVVASGVDGDLPEGVPDRPGREVRARHRAVPTDHRAAGGGLLESRGSARRAGAAHAAARPSRRRRRAREMKTAAVIAGARRRAGAADDAGGPEDRRHDRGEPGAGRRGLRRRWRSAR